MLYYNIIFNFEVFKMVDWLILDQSLVDNISFSDVYICGSYTNAVIVRL